MHNLISPSLTAPVARCSVPESPLYTTKALIVLKRNLAHLLTDRKENQATLARAVGHSKAWINKFLNDTTDRTEIKIKDVDQLASFFGVEPYQLFQPGISRLTERRTGVERRSGRERRIGAQGRQLAGLRTELNKVPSMASLHGSQTSSRPSASPEPIQRILARTEAEIHAFYAGRQAPTSRVSRAAAPERSRKAGRSHAPAK